MEGLFNVMQLKETAQKDENLEKNETKSEGW